MPSNDGVSTGPRRGGLYFILVTVLIDTIGLGIVIPVMPELLMELTGEGVSAAARYGGWLIFVYALMQFVCSPIIGNLSDRFGRRPVLLLSLFGFAIDYVIMGFASTLTVLFIGRTLSGISGATYGTANAYIADVSPPEERAQNFGLVGAAFGLGFILGPMLGGMLGAYGTRVPFFAAAGLSLVNMLYGITILPETLPKEARRPFEWRRANPLGALEQIRNFPVVMGLAGVLFLYQMGHQVNPSVWSFYTMEKFGWSPLEVGYSLAFVGLMIVGVQGGLTRRIIPRIGEVRSAYVGLSVAAIGYLGFAYAPNGWILCAWLAPWAFCGLTMPSIQGIMTRTVSASQQGELQGAVGSLASLTTIIAPPLLTQLFGYFSADTAPIYFPGAPFVAAAIVTALAMLLFWRATQRVGVGA